jgi:hypothetical protein
VGRTGKIARLPVEIREELNRRMLAGEGGPKLLPWLNSHPDVLTVLTAEYDGQPVNDTNLSNWRNGGFEEWCGRRDRLQHVKDLSQFAVKLAAQDGGNIADGAAAIAAGQLLELFERLDPHDPEAFKAAVQSLTSLRGVEVSSQRLALEREKLARKDEEIALAKAQFEHRLKEYQDRIAAQKRELEGAVAQARDGGLTPEALSRIEQQVKLL